MYRYDEFDHQFVRQRVERFRDQVNRRLDGLLTEDEFKPLRLQNGLYLQLHAYMLRVAIPYGTISSTQMRRLADIADRWDRGYGHFTTRQNIQFNWPTLKAVPDILDALADVGMHAIQTSGNCIRNVTADHFAGAAADEIADPRPTAELLRQWSTDHPEFAYLPRKFKMAVTGSPTDRAVTKAHDIGLRMHRDESGNPVYEVIVGGGLGRTPVVGEVLHSALPGDKLLPYIEAIMRVYNLAGRRDNKYKARIKILVKAMGIDAFRHAVDAQFERVQTQASADAYGLDPQEQLRIERYFAPPAFLTDSVDATAIARRRRNDPDFERWYKNNLSEHRNDRYAIVTISLKKPGAVPGDASSAQMRAVAAIANQFAHDEIRVSHEQNLVLPHVPRNYLISVYEALMAEDLATANAGLISDIIACPGMDYCALATARSIPVAQDIASQFSDPALADAIGPLKIKISGCINACAHHHVGHIGILGLDKGGHENYQFTFGGDHTESLSIGERAGPGIDADAVVPAVQRVVNVYLQQRQNDQESFAAACKRLGNEPFKEALYASAN
jgi:sulfite reductase (NADPH) hemoprotein beta-component